MDTMAMITEMKHYPDSDKLKGLFVLDRFFFEQIYSPEDVQIISSLVDIYGPVQTRDMVASNPEILREADVIFSGWGVITYDDMPAEYLDNLKVLFYGAGSVKHFISEEFWEKGIRVSSAAIANAVPVAEYTLGHIFTGLKRCWYYANQIRQKRTFVPSKCDVPGGFNSTVGLISLGNISKILCKYLSPFDLDIIAYDPYVNSDFMQGFSVTMVSLDDIFCSSDIVSLHAPLTNETSGMITGDHIMRMKYGSTFINTARGEIVREDEMIEALQKRPDITAIIDVTCPEPASPNSLLYDLPNVLLTPHIAGAVGGERRRLGRFVVDELRRYLSGRPLKGEIRQELLSIQA